MIPRVACLGKLHTASDKELNDALEKAKQQQSSSSSSSEESVLRSPKDVVDDVPNKPEDPHTITDEQWKTFMFAADLKEEELKRL